MFSSSLSLLWLSSSPLILSYNFIHHNLNWKNNAFLSASNREEKARREHYFNQFGHPLQTIVKNVLARPMVVFAEICNFDLKASSNELIFKLFFKYFFLPICFYSVFVWFQPPTKDPSVTPACLQFSSILFSLCTPPVLLTKLSGKSHLLGNLCSKDIQSP